jgi:hypothetical protein
MELMKLEGTSKRKGRSQHKVQQKKNMDKQKISKKECAGDKGARGSVVVKALFYKPEANEFFS